MNETKEFTIWIGSTVVRSVAASVLAALKAEMIVARSASYKKASVVEKQTGKTTVFHYLHMSGDGEFSYEREEELPLRKKYRVFRVYASQRSLQHGWRKSTPELIGEYFADSPYGATLTAARMRGGSANFLEATEIEK